MSKHTSGPWKVYHALLRPQFPGHKIIEVQDRDGQAVVQWAGFDNCDRREKTHLANAHLMAAAPDLLAALTAAAVYLKRDTPAMTRGAINSAIAKATALTPTNRGESR
jgi:hypothetical protein